MLSTTTTLVSSSRVNDTAATAAAAAAAAATARKIKAAATSIAPSVAPLIVDADADRRRAWQHAGINAQLQESSATESSSSSSSEEEEEEEESPSLTEEDDEEEEETDENDAIELRVTARLKYRLDALSLTTLAEASPMMSRTYCCGGASIPTFLGA